MEDNSSGNTATHGLANRVRTLVLRPSETWQRIAREPATPSELIIRVALPLAAIGPVADLLRGQVWGYGTRGFSYKPGLTAELSRAIISYILGVAGVIMLALIADWLAPKFAGASDRANAFKLIVWGSTVAWASGIFRLVPGFGFLSLIGLYSLYLFYAGTSPLMRVPPEKSVGYTAVTLLAALILYLAIAMLATPLVGLFGSAGV